MSTIEQQELKQLVKDALKEVVLENSEALRELLIEVLEDCSLLRRMEEGRETELVSRERIMELLEPKT